MGLFCDHQWEILDKTEGMSELEAASKYGVEKFSITTDGCGRIIGAHQKIVVTICHCTECGKIKKFESIV
jgi:hypothetical protein